MELIYELLKSVINVMMFVFILGVIYIVINLNNIDIDEGDD